MERRSGRHCIGPRGRKRGLAVAVPSAELGAGARSAPRERLAVAFVPAVCCRLSVVWQSDQGGNGLDVYARTFNASAGVTPVTEWVVNGPLTGGAGAQHSAVVAYAVAYDSTTRVAAD